MKKPKANTQQEKAEIEQLSQAELVELVVTVGCNQAESFWWLPFDGTI